MRTVLTIAGSDSGAGAGIQADLKTFAALGVYGVTAVTAVTAQNTVDVLDTVVLPADFVAAQIEAIAGDVEIHATKTGMLATAAVVEAVAAAIDELQLPRVVVDPVMMATGGRALIDEDGTRMLKAELLPRAMVVTPNIPEAEALSGRRISSVEDMRAAAQVIRGFGPSAVIVTGGHRPGNEIIDVLFDGNQFTECLTLRVTDGSMHGTGCTFSAAVAAHLACGAPLADAAARAQQYVANAIRHSIAVGKGQRVLGHLDHQIPSR
jgi:hydroxymethylpyrimidine/phosphomethylpyrimidine kinase